MPSFSIPLSGLDANSQALSSIANNLANMNTIGYRGFHHYLPGHALPESRYYRGGIPHSDWDRHGTRYQQCEFHPGTSMETTGVDTDMMIQGQGFFVVQNGAEQLYTRAGNFSVGSDGTLQATGWLQRDGRRCHAERHHRYDPADCADYHQVRRKHSGQCHYFPPDVAEPGLRCRGGPPGGSPSWCFQTPRRCTTPKCGQHGYARTSGHRERGVELLSTLRAADLGTTGDPVSSRLRVRWVLTVTATCSRLRWIRPAPPDR